MPGVESAMLDGCLPATQDVCECLLVLLPNLAADGAKVG